MNVKECPHPGVYILKLHRREEGLHLRSHEKKLMQRLRHVSQLASLVRALAGRQLARRRRRRREREKEVSDNGGEEGIEEGEAVRGNVLEGVGVAPSISSFFF